MLIGYIIHDGGFGPINKNIKYKALQFALRHKDCLSYMQLALYKSLDCSSEYVFMQTFSYYETGNLNKIRELAGFALPYTMYGIVEYDVGELRMLSDLTIKEIKQLIYRW